jgi:hypothetical protein
MTTRRRPITDRVRELLERETLADGEEETLGDRVARAIVEGALQRDAKFMNLLLERLEGPAPRRQGNGDG